jgi:SAM-dependent methyltransferase
MVFTRATSTDPARSGNLAGDAEGAADMPATDLDPEDLPEGLDAARFARAALAAGDPTGWFDQLYTAAATAHATVPWDRHAANPELVRWARAAFGGRAQSGTAVVVGCGYGDDAEYVASLGFDTVGFDLSPAAVDGARARFGASPVDYRVADLLEPPQHWQWAFDLVVDCYTVQALPEALHPVAADALTDLVAAGGRLLMIAIRADGPAPAPPWPLRRDELDAVRLTAESIDVVADGGQWLALYRRPA